MADAACTEKELTEAVRALPKEVRQFLGHKLRNRLTTIMAHAEVAGHDKVRDEVIDMSSVLTLFHL